MRTVSQAREDVPVRPPRRDHAIPPTLRVAGGLAAAGAGCLAWAAGYEVRAFRLRRFDVPVLPVGAGPVRVLHLSDLHMTPGQRRKREWVRSLAALEPDLVVDTGDNLAHAEAVPAVLDALAPLLALPGVFVLGSNDYFGPRPKNPAAYLAGPAAVVGRHRRLPTGDLVKGLVEAGWADLDNARTTLEVAGLRIDLVGVDDPHIDRDRYLDVAAPADPAADLTLGVAHAPYRRVLDPMTADGADLVLAGHTHGGQLCLPGYGALVTNCDLPRSHAKGLHRWRSGRHETWLHVSAGLGTSPYAPVRFACPPEATLLTLRPRSGRSG
jgi:predicted MPP superfamily phosphohydrolase